MSAAGSVTVPAWGERRGKRKVPRRGPRPDHWAVHERYPAHRDGWKAQAHGPRPSRPTGHASVGDALQAILRSSWARKLGARAAPDVYWSDRATRLEAKAYRKSER